MCDQDHFENDRRQYEALGLVTRKQFGILLGAGMAMMLPQVANAAAVTESDVSVATPDDAGSATPIQQLMPLAQTLNETTHMTDAKAFIGWLDRQSPVAKNRKMGTQGYCMGGPIAFRTVAAAPDRVGAVASFHGGGLVTDTPNSPHLQAAKTKAQFLIAIAANDDMRSPNEKTVLKETFAKANLPAEIEVYTGAAHGWCPPDSGVYNEPQAEKAWSRLLLLYGKL